MASRRDNSDAFADSDIFDKDCIPPFEYDDDVCDTRLPERWFCRNHYPTGRKLHSYSKPDYLVELSLALKDHKEEMDKILNSQFGKLFDVPLRRLAFSGQLVHGLLTRQLQCYRRHERWFIFGPKPIKFSLREFYLVTGLKCDPYDKSSPEAAGSVSEEQEGDALNLSEEQPVDPPQVAASHWDTLIAAGQMGKDGSIDQLINRLKSGEQMEGDTRLQLALVILADGVVAVENQNGKVSRKTVELVKDVDKFLSYSWGRKAFELTMLNFTDMVRNKGMKDRLTMPSISMRGFPIAIQLLALEAILELQAKLPSASAELDFTPRSCRCILDRFIDNAARASLSDDARPFFQRCLLADNPTALLLEGLRTLFIELDPQRAVVLFGQAPQDCPYIILAQGMGKILTGNWVEGLQRLEDLRWWVDIEQSGNIAARILKAVIALGTRKVGTFLSSYAFPTPRCGGCRLRPDGDPECVSCWIFCISYTFAMLS